MRAHARAQGFRAQLVVAAIFKEDLEDSIGSDDYVLHGYTSEPIDQENFDLWDDPDAIEVLNEENGLNKSSISKYMESTYGDLPARHLKFLSDHLNRIKDRTSTTTLVTTATATGRPRGRPPKVKRALTEWYCYPDESLQLAPNVNGELVVEEILGKSDGEKNQSSVEEEDGQHAHWRKSNRSQACARKP
ncbi:hypothetical protein FNV43_RR12936 [Rhamnella rubrinervis]|uniref:Uncharacterized protein n=1 Tax=Rhamnella rubrinervis TaxID=2594499 RepID=A0A8K0MDA8_9ROSA|nr:hypothetical protein FNV43_RR12936 [Rhamnella rubrinervis]